MIFVLRAASLRRSVPFGESLAIQGYMLAETKAG